MEWIIQLPILFFSVMVHEFCHGWIALRNGDDTALRNGRLSFNPISHIDPFGTLVLPALCVMAHFPPIGWAKPVPVDSRKLRSPRMAMVRVAMAGPFSNLALSFAAAVAFKLSAGLPAFFPLHQEILLNALLFGVQINLMLAFFNLIPIHPLDGSGVLSGFLPLRARLFYDRHKPYGFAIILLMVNLGITRSLMMAPSAFVLNLLARMGLIW